MHAPVSGQRSRSSGIFQYGENMTVRWETTQVDGKTMRIYLGVPDRPGPHPGLVVAQHAGGVDAQIQDAVHRLHREGYAVAAPELFHRQPADTDPKQRTALL